MMKKLNRVLGIAGVVTLLLAVGNWVTLVQIKQNLLSAEPPEWLAGLVAVSILLLAAMTVFQLLGVFLQFRHFNQADLLSSALFVLGFFSLFMLAVAVVMLQDIGQEMKVGFESTGEWNMVFFSFFLQTATAFLILLKSVRYSKKSNEDSEMPVAEKDEAVFLTVHQVGIFSGSLGFLCMLLLKFVQVPQGFLEGLFVLSAIVALCPYAMAAFYWLMMKRKEKPVEWYDEKQFMDISKGALITLGISVLAMSVVFVLMVFNVVPDSMKLWFPVYLCGILLMFSASNQVIANQ